MMPLDWQSTLIQISESVYFIDALDFMLREAKKKIMEAEVAKAQLEVLKKEQERLNEICKLGML